LVLPVMEAVEAHDLVEAAVRELHALLTAQQVPRPRHLPARAVQHAVRWIEQHAVRDVGRVVARDAARAGPDLQDAVVTRRLEQGEELVGPAARHHDVVDRRDPVEAAGQVSSTLGWRRARSRYPRGATHASSAMGVRTAAAPGRGGCDPPETPLAQRRPAGAAARARRARAAWTGR